MLLSIKDRTFGEMDIKITGLAPEKLLNIAVNNRLKLRNLRRESYTVIYATISTSDYSLLKKKLPNDKYKIERLKVHGLTPLFWGLRKRYALFAGIIIFTVLAFIASFRVWNIEVRGCETIEKQVVLQQLNNYGLKIGKHIDGVMLDECEKQLLNDMPELSWVSLSLNGVCLKADINEKPKMPDLIPRNTPADILATKDGVISSITVLQGQAVVKEGQTVKKGDVLISGQLVFSGVPYQYISANGSVKARVWYSSVLEVPMYEFVKVRTGNSIKVRYLDMLGMRIHIEGENKFASSEYEETMQTVMQMGIPVKMTTTIYYETNDIKVELSQQEASEKAERIMQDQLSQKLPENSVFADRNVISNLSEDKSTLKVQLYIETLEEIGVYTELLK